MKILKGLTLLAMPIILIANNINFIERFIDIKVDNQKVTLSTNKSGQIKIGDKEYPVSASINPISKFSHPNISFKFSSDLNANYEEYSVSKLLIKNWSLNGDNLNVMIVEYPAKIPAKLSISKIINKYKKMQAKIDIKPFQIKLNSGKTLKGKNIMVEIGELKISQNIFILQGENKTISLTIQDMLTLDNKNTEEYYRFIKRIKESLELNGLAQ